MDMKKCMLAPLAALCVFGTTSATQGQAIDQIRKLYNSDSDAQDYFGTSVEISGDKAIIGAMNYDVGTTGYRIGGAWIFDLTNGSQLQLVRSDPNTDPGDLAGDLFGYICAISGSTAIVGSSNDDDNGTNSGSAYLFDADTGSELYKLTADDGAIGDAFGKYVSIEGSIAVATAIHDKDGMGQVNIGSAYLYNANTGQQLTITNLTSGNYQMLTNKLRASDGGMNQNFGKDIAMTGNYIVISSGIEDTDTGKAYVYELSNIDLMNDTVDVTEIAILTPTGGSPVPYFGTWVDISGTTAIVGARGGSGNNGYAYLFDVTTGSQLHELAPVPAIVGDEFGYSVAIDGSLAVVGAPTANDRGAAYIYDVSTGEQIGKFESEDIDSGDRFGRAVGIKGSTILVGAILEQVGGMVQAGSAYQFTLDLPPAPIQINKVLDDNGVPSDLFASFIATNGTLTAYGLPGSTLSASHGAVLITDAQTGVEIAKFTASDGAAGDQFGTSISMNSSLIVIGAPGDDDNGNNSGSAYIFDLATETQLFKLLSSDGAAGDDFGRSVSIASSFVLIGSPRDDDNGTASGSAYQFDPATGSQVAKILPNDGASKDRFGQSVLAYYAFGLSMLTPSMAIGAPGDDDEGSASGSVYIFERPMSVFTQTDKITPSLLDASDAFGSSLASNGTTLVVGAPGDDTGVTYLFNAIDFDVVPLLLVPSDGASGDAFGTTVGINYPNIVVGSYRNDENGSNAGAAYVYDVVTGYQIGKLLADDGAADDEFGTAVAISIDYVFVGAPKDDDNGGASGSAYTYGLELCLGDCDGSGTIDYDDLVMIIANYGAADPGDRCDTDQSRIISFADVTAALFNFGPCP